MEAWAHQQNIERLQKGIHCECDVGRRRILEDVLASERQRLAELEQSSAKPDGQGTGN